MLTFQYLDFSASEYLVCIVVERGGVIIVDILLPIHASLKDILENTNPWKGHNLMDIVISELHDSQFQVKWPICQDLKGWAM